MAKSKKESNGNGGHLGFEDKLWASADKLRGYVGSRQFKPSRKLACTILNNRPSLAFSQREQV